MNPDEARRQEREERIAALEGRLSRRSPVGVRPPVAVVALGAALFLLSSLRRDLAYFFSPTTPLSLGAEGEYRFDAFASNRYAQVHGIPTLRGAYTQERAVTWVAVGLRDTPLFVWRQALGGEDWAGSGAPPQPNQSPFAVRGRLLAQQDAPGRFRDAFEKLAAMGEVRPRDGKRWVLIEGERPRADVGVLLYAAALALFFATNGFFLWRGLIRRAPADGS